MNNPIGRWRIKWMEMWDQDFVDLIEPGYFRFDDDGQRIEFSWSENDDGRIKSGRGWFQLASSRSAKGRFYIHCGDESALEMELQT